MIIIPGELIALVTFPGVIVHEISHKFMCDLFGVPVYHVSYFTIGDRNAGHVIHQKIDSVTQGLLIALAPLFINSILCMLFTLPLFSAIYITGELLPISSLTYASFMYMILGWLGISIGGNAFPSNQDVASVLEIAQKSYVIVFVISGIVRLLNFFSQIWLSFIYAGAISFLLPRMLFS